MRYQINPSAFKVAHWQKLYKSCIADATAASQLVHSGKAIFVLIDAEPWGEDNAKPVEIGIPLMAASILHETWSHTPTPSTLDEVMQRYKLDTHYLSLSGWKRLSKSIERHRFGSERSVSDDEVEGYIVDLVRLFHERYYAGQSDIPVILVGFDLVFEFRLLSTLYVQLTTRFHSWLDLQEMAAALSDIKRPGLSDTLKACGFGDKNMKYLHSRQGQHNAATDTDGNGTLVIPQPSARGLASSKCRTLEFAHEKQVWDGTRPQRKELYPYTARVRRATGNPFSAGELLEIFADYAPVAASVRKNRPYSWVCLEDLEALNNFVRKMNGENAGENGDVWSVVSDHDASIVPVRSMTELRQRLRPQEDVKREQRRLKRLRNDSEPN